MATISRLVFRAAFHARPTPAVKPCLSFVFRAALLLLLAPPAALADIYKWHDEQGKLVISNVPPAEMTKAKNYQLVMKETKPVASAPIATSAERAATPTELALLRRIETLERELQAQQHAYQPAPLPDPASYGAYYPPPPPPPAAYYSSSYPSYYPVYTYRTVPTYAYVRALPTYSYVAYPAARVIARPVPGFVHGPAFHGAGRHSGRR